MTCYLINGSPSAPLDFDNPERVWTGQNVSYSYLKVFGGKAFAHVPNEKRLKLDDKAILCIVIGYNDDEFGYKLWDPERNKIIRSRDMVFYEHEIDSKSINPKVVADAVTRRIIADPCVYVRTLYRGNFVILLLFVGDMLIVGQDRKMIEEPKKELSKSFEMKDLGQARQIWKMQIGRDRKTKRFWLSS
ncbi:hypothetical protein RJ639_043439 [Escallonia herrerae]|uniref:Uncharacterized protein n=1 Tax=Escallonia herrerae TaxID=1293975 RepID=A0AA88WBA6_9ASTE|nr:hypothetical protein RJ639_043439 [Escallonia herrerae]